MEVAAPDVLRLIPQKKKLRLPVWIGGLVLISIAAFSEDPNAGLSWVPQLLTVILFCSLGPEFLAVKTDLKMPRALKMIVLWAAVAGVSTVILPVNEGINEYYLTTVKVIGMAILFAYVVKEQKDMEILLWHLVASCVVVVALNYGDLQRYYVSAQSATIQQQRFAGTLGNANIMALYVLIVVWAACTIVAVNKAKFRWIALAALPVAVWIIILTASRKGILGIPILLITAYWFHARATVGKSFLGKAVMLVLFVAITWTSTELLLSTSQANRLMMVFEGREEASASARLDMALAGLKVFAENPVLGVGFDNFKSVGWRYGSQFDAYSHSTVIEVLSCTGIIGFVLYFGALASLFALFYPMAMYHSEKATSKVFQWALCLWVIFLWFNIFSVQFESKLIWAILGALAGFASRQRRELGVEKQKLVKRQFSAMRRLSLSHDQSDAAEVK